MIEKIVKYLSDANSNISTREIIEKFFHVVGKYPPQMEKIVENMLRDDARLVCDGVGEWSIKKNKARLLSEVIFSLVDLDTVLIDRRTKVPLFMAIARIQNSKMISKQLYSMETQTAFSPQLKQLISQHQTGFMPDGAFQAHAFQIYRSIQNTVLIHYSPTGIISTLNYFFRSTIGMELEIEPISLVRLIRKLFPEIKIRSIEDIAGALKISYPEPLNLPARIDLLVEILNHLIEKLVAAQMTTFESLTDLLEKGERLIDFSTYHFNREYIKNLPTTPGVYFMKDRKGEVFYVGKARNLKSRVESYFVDRTDQDARTKKILNRLYNLSYEAVGSELEAFLLEHHYIKQYQPALNTQINVHPFDLTGFRQKNIVLFLPAVREDQLVLLFVKGMQAARKIILSKKNPDWQSCDDLLTEIFFSSKLIKSDYREEQLEIIWRWLSVNQESVNFLDVDQAGAKANCLAQMKSYVADSELLDQKISYV